MTYHTQFNDVLSFGQHRVWKKMAVKWSGAKRGSKALDVCCGSGDLAMLLAQTVGPTGEVGVGRCGSAHVRMCVCHLFFFATPSRR